MDNREINNWQANITKINNYYGLSTTGNWRVDLARLTEFILAGGGGGGGGSGDGATFTPSGAVEGSTVTFSWTNDKGKPNPTPVAVTAPQGVKGDKGDTGAQGAKGDKGDTGENGTNGTNGKDGLTVSITVNGKTKTQVNGVITLDDYATATQQIELTASQVASGVTLPENSDISITGEVNNFVITATGSDVGIQFVAGSAVAFTFPANNGWAGATPTFTQGKLYTVGCYKGSWLSDEGRRI